MFRGGFPLNSWANLNYATYFSVTRIQTRLWIPTAPLADAPVMFFTRPRIEVGGSWQKVLQWRTGPTLSDSISPGSPRPFRSTCAPNTHARITAAVTGLKAPTV